MLIHPFVPSARATSPCDPAKSTQTVPLPNGSKLPTASISAESSEEIFLRWTGFVTKLGPQINPSHVPIFGVNSDDKSPVLPGHEPASSGNRGSVATSGLERLVVAGPWRQAGWSPQPLTGSTLASCRGLTRCSWSQGYAWSAQGWWCS
jgi:hypothetical protein